MIAIVNTDENFGIGFENNLLFTIPNDMKFFREQTLGKVVIMGRKTFLSLPNAKPLKDRLNIILTKDDNFSIDFDNAVVINSIDKLLAYIKKYNSDETFVIGGGAIYKELLPFCHTVLITKVLAKKTADVYFPNIDKSDEWVLAQESEEHEHEGIFYKFCKYCRM